MSGSAAAAMAVAVALLVQLAPALFLGRPLGVADILGDQVPWRVDGAPAPQNALLDDCATSLAPWTVAFLRDGDLLATPAVACGAVGPIAGLFGLLSPFVLLPFALLPRALALTGMAALDLVFAFAAFYLWRRRRGDAELPAALGAAVWAWAPARVVWRLWPHAGLLALFPLLLLAVDLELEDAPRRLPAPRRALLAAALVTGLVLGGHPSFALLGVEVAALYALGRAFAARRRFLPLAPLCGAGAALLLLAPVLSLGRSFLAEGEWLAARESLTDSRPVPWRILLLFLDPYHHGNPADGTWRGLAWNGPDNLVELQLYMGLATFLLAPMALASARRRETAFWGALGAGALLAMIAGGPFAWAARLLPGQDVVFLSRVKPLVLLAAAALTTLGAAALAATPLGARRGTLPALLALLTLDLSYANLRFDPFPERPDAPPPQTPALAALRRLAPGDGRRFLGFANALPPNVATELRLEDVRAHLLHSAGYRRFLSRLDPSVFGRHGTFLTFEAGTFRTDAAARTALDLLGVAALIGPPGGAAPGGDFTPAHRGPDADVYARPWRAPARVVARGGAQRLGAPRALRPPTPPGLGETGRVTSFTATGLTWRLEIEAAEASTLLLGRSRLPLLDTVRVGKRGLPPREDTRAEGLLAVDVPAGKTTLTVTPELPPRLIVLSALGLALLVALADAARRPAIVVSPRS